MNRHLVAIASKYMPVKTVVRDIQLATDKPLGVRNIPFANGVPILIPINQVSCLLGPETFIVGCGLVIQVGSNC